MIDQWFKNDLQQIYEQHNVAVFIDESGEVEFLLKTVESIYTVYHAHTELEELYVKYMIEKVQPSHEKYLIYTRTKKDRLTFIREYCETCGCLEIRNLQNYVRDKVYEILNLNITLSNDEIMSAAKISVGKDKAYWMDLCYKGATEIFNLDKDLLEFLNDPILFSEKRYDEQLREVFYRKVNELLGKGYLKKPPTTLAQEVVTAMLGGLLNGQCNKKLVSTYEKWLDSVSYRDSFNKYLEYYPLNLNVDIWNVSINHPFRQIDEKWLTEIGNSLANQEIIAGKLPKLRNRNKSKQAQTLGICFWSDVITLLEFDPKNISYLSAFNECVEYYKKHFCKLDTAIRNLYTEFLDKKKILEPFQELYKEYVSIFLDKWFTYWEEYKENQTGTLQRIFNESSSEKIAIIVGDGVAYEIAKLVAEKVKGSASLKKNSILADIPSETENNMSRIYMSNGVTEAIQAKREKYLVAENPDVNIDFIRLDKVTEETQPGQFLICTYKDIDEIGEKVQQKALKYFPTAIDFFAEKISLLLSNGYAKVYLITDHGFVLTGLLTEADKISASPIGDCKKAERYIRTEKRQIDLTPGLIEVKKSYHKFEYIYFAKSMNSFKTPGLYGFSHGGISPQELITPYFCWERINSSALPVTIENKSELQDVTGELFSIVIQAREATRNLFTLNRKVYLVFFSNKKQVHKSSVLSIAQNETITKEYTFDGHPEMEIQLLDADTKELLDRSVIKQNNERDLHGLF